MSTLDPIGTQGASKTAPSDLQLALEGGDEFAARMKQLAMAKADAETALQNLGLGRNIRQAQADAKVTVAAAVSESNALRLQAENELASAKQQAETIVGAATANAAQIVAAAHAKAGDELSAAAKTKQDAQQYAGQKAAEIDALKTEATEHRASADKTNTDALAVLQQHRDALSRTQLAEAAATSAKAEFETKIEQLHKALRDIVGV